MPRYFMQLSYKGTNYHGWQIQPNKVSVQEMVNKALSTVLKENINVVGAGRTDTGVHASYFVAHFDANAEYLQDMKKTIYNLNSILPDDISIQRIFEVGQDNHARFDAISRTYKYFIASAKDPFKNEFTYRNYHSFDVVKMNMVCDILYDYEDYTSFSKLHTDVKTNNCEVYLARWDLDAPSLVFTIKANRFLRNMVRSIVGTMLDVGLGKISPEGFIEIIEAKDRGAAGASVPAKGLFLTNIEYPYPLG